MFLCSDPSDICGSFNLINYDDCSHFGERSVSPHHQQEGNHQKKIKVAAVRTATSSTTTRSFFSSFWTHVFPQREAKCASLHTDEDDFILIQSQVIFRHGARTPVVTIPNVAEARYDKRIFHAVLSHTDFDYEVLDLSGAKADSIEDSPAYKSYAKGLLEGGMKRGHLTTVGMHQCFLLGLDLRRRYMHKYKLIDANYNEREVYMRSTYLERTIESLQGVVAGIYGVDQLSKHKPKFYIDYHTEEYIYPNRTACPCFSEICLHGMESMGNGSRNVALMKRIEKAIDYDPRTMRHIPSFLVRQDMMCRLTHGLVLPSQLEHMFDEIAQQAPSDFMQAVAGKPEDRAAGLRLGLGRFYHMLLTNMDVATRGNHKHKLSLYSSHDSMIMPLLVSIGNIKSHWPGYASNIAYELWKHNKSGRFFAKVLYNGEEMLLPGKKESMVPYQEFKELLAPFTLTHSQHKYLCENTRASIEAPPVEYSLHHDDTKLEGGSIDTGDSPLPPGM